MLPRIALWLVGALALPCSLLSSAERRVTPLPAPDVSIRNVRSDLLRQAGGWLEVDVQLAVKPKSSSVRFADRVRVTLLIAYEPTGAEESELRYFRSLAEAVALPDGESHLRFYLPPEVVERDRVRPDRLHFLVELESSGQTMPIESAGTSSSVRSPAQLNRFRTQAAAQAPANDGILVPQVLSPFANDPRRPAPTLVR